MIQSKGDYKNQISESRQNEIFQYNANVKIQFQFEKDGILRKENKIYNKETIKFSLIKQAILTEYQLPSNLDIMYKGKKVDLNSNISSILQDSECPFILKQQENMIDQQLITLKLIFFEDRLCENQQIQVYENIEISLLYNLVQQKLKQNNFDLFYNGQVIKNQEESTLQLKEDVQNEIEVIFN